MKNQNEALDPAINPARNPASNAARNAARNPAIDAMLTQALERSPQPMVPVDFAARVCAALPPQRAPRPAAHTARTTALAAAIALTVALFLIAPHASPTFASLSFDIELLVLAQLLGITYWLAAKREI